MDEQMIKNFRIGHAMFNSIVFLLFIYQAYLGLSIRRSKLAGNIDVNKIQKHKRNGPIWVVLAILGYLAGLTLVTIDQGRPFTFPVHLIIGSLLIILIVATFIISRRMTSDQKLRDAHRKIGIGIISLYLIQAIIGVGVLSSFGQ